MCVSVSAQLLVSVSVVLLMRTVRKSEGPVFQSLPLLPAALQSLVQRGQPCALFYLYLSQVCLFFESKELLAAVRSLKKSFPVPPSRSLSEAAVKKISARMSESAQLLLGRYVEIHALQLQHNIMQPTINTATTTEYSSEETQPSSISAFVGLLHDRLLCVQVETSELIPKKRPADDKQSQKNSTSASLSAGRSSAHQITTTRSSASVSSSSSSNSAQRDFARLFSARVATFSAVRLNRVDVLVAVLRVVFQCWIEHVRQCHFQSAGQLQQVELDVTAVRQCVLPHSVQFDELDEQQRLIHSQLDEVSHSAIERCSDEVAAAVHSLSNQHIDALLGRFQQLQQQYRE